MSRKMGRVAFVAFIGLAMLSGLIAVVGGCLRWPVYIPGLILVAFMSVGIAWSVRESLKEGEDDLR